MAKNILITISYLVLLAVSSWASDFNPGMYEIKSEVEIPGMPASIPPQTMVECLTEIDLLAHSNSVIQGCKIFDLKQTETSVSWEMECHQQGQKMTGSGKVTYHGDTIEGTIITNFGPESGNMTMTTMITGQRISDCD